VLLQINVKGNQLERISEYAFAGLEETLTELELTENKLRTFPTAALRRLEQLRALHLAWNEVQYGCGKNFLI
jgi:hypothetical protein